MEKAVVYVRVSSEEQAKHGFSIDNQKRQCIELPTIEILKQVLKKGLKLILALIIEKTPQVVLRNSR